MLTIHTYVFIANRAPCVVTRYGSVSLSRHTRVSRHFPGGIRLWFAEQVWFAGHARVHLRFTV